jgi:hypothetical protein
MGVMGVIMGGTCRAEAWSSSRSALLLCASFSLLSLSSSDEYMDFSSAGTEAFSSKRHRQQQ